MIRRLQRFWNERQEVAIMCVLALVALVVLVAGAVAEVKANEAFDKHCALIGGHIITYSKAISGVDAKGQTVTSVSETRYCLNEQGGILDIG